MPSGDWISLAQLRLGGQQLLGQEPTLPAEARHTTRRFGFLDIYQRDNDPTDHPDMVAIVEYPSAEKFIEHLGDSQRPQEITKLPRHRRPRSLGGRGKDPVWGIPSSNLGAKLIEQTPKIQLVTASSSLLIP
jgi:hypothetical protein